MLVMSPPAMANSGTHDGFDDGQTMMSPGSDGLEVGLRERHAGRTPDDPGRRAGPAQFVGFGRGDADAIESIAFAVLGGACRPVRGGRIAREAGEVELGGSR